MRKQLRILKVLVQPVLVMTDEDGFMQELVQEPREVSGREWANDYSTRAILEVAESERQLNIEARSLDAGTSTEAGGDTSASEQKEHSSQT